MERDDLWIKPGDWKSYEAYVTGSLARRFPSAKIRSDAKLLGLKSGAQRQIDVLVEGQDRIAFDCKCYKRKVDIKHVEEFLGMLDDLGVHYGVMVTTNGYSKAALRRARNDPRQIELQILPPERLSQYQHLGEPLIWRNGLGIFLTRPQGWVADNELSNTQGAFQVAMYPLGHTLGSAGKSAPFMYANILTLNSSQKNMQEFSDWHEFHILSDNPATIFEHWLTQITDERGETRHALLGSAEIASMGFGRELRLYVNYEKHILLLVMLSPPEQSDALKKVLIRAAEQTFSLVVEDKRSADG